MQSKIKTVKKSKSEYEYDLRVVGKEKRQKVIFSKPLRRGKFFQDAFRDKITGNQYLVRTLDCGADNCWCMWNIVGEIQPVCDEYISFYTPIK
jgi:hypothetical protein|tara:strand:- start:113 stop:391 length:279 start_codon:yes stop_codon:yes gene_type:complete